MTREEAERNLKDCQKRVIASCKELDNAAMEAASMITASFADQKTRVSPKCFLPLLGLPLAVIHLALGVYFQFIGFTTYGVIFLFASIVPCIVLVSVNKGKKGRREAAVYNKEVEFRNNFSNLEKEEGII